MSDILVEREEAIATVIINRPRMRNAISYAMWGELARVTHRLGDDNAPLSVRGAKITIQLYLEGLNQARRDRLHTLALKAFESQDYKEGTRAFLEKRRPRFQGR